MERHTKKIALRALLAAMALVLGWLESLLPAFSAIPGVKLGLGNLVTVFALYRLSAWDAAGISLARVVLTAAAFGNAYSLAYSLAGAAVSLAVMLLLKRTGKFSILGVSAAGGVGHNLGQLAVAMAVLGTARLGWYLPVLLVSGTLAGAGIGAAGGLAAERARLP